jgi:hypothetical protein
MPPVEPLSSVILFVFVVVALCCFGLGFALGYDRAHARATKRNAEEWRRALAAEVRLIAASYALPPAGRAG